METEDFVVYISFANAKGPSVCVRGGGDDDDDCMCVCVCALNIPVLIFQLLQSTEQPHVA